MDSPNGMESNDFAASHMDVVHEASSTAKMEKTGDPSAEAVATSSETSGGDGGELGMSDEELARLLAKQFEEEESRALEEDESFARQLQAIEEHERERQRAEQRRQHQMMQQQQQQQQQRHQQQQRLEQQLQQYLEQAQRQLASALTTSGAASPSPLSSSSSASSSPAAFSLSSSASSSSSPSPWAHMLSTPSTTTPSSSLSSSAPTPYLFPGGGGPVSMPPMMSMPMMPTPFGSVPPPPVPPPSSTLQAGGSWSLYQQVRAAKKAREEGDSAAGGPTSSLSSSSSSLSSAPTDSSPAQLTFTCPICLEGGIKEEELYTHTTERHSDVGQVRHVCPVCASRPNGNPNYKSRDYAGHVGLRHKPAHLRGPDEGEEDESARAPPPQLRQSRARTHLITRTARGFRMISNRSLETLMDYLIHVDTDVVQLPGCQLCHRRLKPTHTRAILECGHHYHAQCLPSDTPSPTCPLCDRKQQAAARRILSSSSSSQREEGASDDAGGGDSAVMAAPIEEAETSAMTCEE